jgi:hypothetical protein
VTAPDSDFLWAAGELQLSLFDMPRIRHGDPRCVDCGVDTVEAREGYMVRDDVWPLDPRGGMLCVGCLERRIGRRLAPADFTDVPINRLPGSGERLRSRLEERRGA